MSQSVLTGTPYPEPRPCAHERATESVRAASVRHGETRRTTSVGAVSGVDGTVGFPKLLSTVSFLARSRSGQLYFASELRYR